MALVAAQVTSPKECIKDGFSKRITKSDFDRLKQKKVLPECEKAEQLMSVAWQTVEKSGLAAEKTALVFGKLQVRLVLLLLSKDKSGEKKQFQSMASIQEQFQEDLVQAATQGSAQPTPAATTSAPSEVVKTLEDASDAQAIALAANKHIKLEGHFMMKKHPGKVWKLVEFTEDGAKLLHQPFFEDPEEIIVVHNEWKGLKEWSKPVPHLIPDVVRDALMPCASTSLDEEMGKAQAQFQLFEKFKEFLVCNALSFVLP